MMDVLEKKDIIEHESHPTSRRAHLVYLTDFGKLLKAEGITLAVKTNEDFMTALSKDEQNTLLKLMNKVVEERAGN